jgi:hypothetical protein
MTAYTLEKRNVIQRRAWNIVADAVRTRELVTPLYCERCGKQCRLDAHHEDYRRPLEVKWLCVACHSQIHGKIRERAWKAIGGRYKRRVKNG